MSRQHTLFATTVLAIGLTAGDTQAQISFEGRPWARKHEKIGLADAPTWKHGALDRAALLAEDELRAADGNKRQRFGVNHAVDLTTENSGVWNVLPNGDRVWRISIELLEAFSVNFEFNTYIVPEGGKVYAYTPTGEVLGAFTAASNPGHQELGVGLLPGERITIEYDEPASVAGQGFLRIGQVTQGYRDSFASQKAFNTSLSCNNNVICPEGDPWRDQIRSVAMIVVNGNGHCTGQLLNNCAEDGTPYFLTANHCLGGNVGTWVFAFNWESSTCATNTNTPMNQTVSGAQLLANSSGSDVALLRLNSTPPASYNVYYTGWNANNTPPTTQTGIHHPDGDQKKISLNGQTATYYTAGQALCWYVTQWDDGTTEGGSSGSGLWGADGLLTGQLFGGTFGCNVNDWYGRFDVSYPLLQSHLGTCGPTLQGYDPNGTVEPVDAAVQSIQGIDAIECNVSAVQPQVVIRNAGSTALTSLTLNWTMTGGGSGSHAWTGNLAASATATVTMPGASVGNGANTYVVTASQPNGTTDPNPVNDARTFNFTVVNPGVGAELAITTDSYGGETTWKIFPEGSTVAITSGGPYPNGENGVVRHEALCLAAGCYRLVIYDDEDDGICCFYGQGSYELVSGGQVLVTGDGEFDDEISHPFCLTGTGVVDINAAGINVWPNPGTGRFDVALPAVLNGPVQVDVLDATGRLVRAQQVAATALFQVDLADQADGVYLLKVIAGERILHQRLVIRR